MSMTGPTLTSFGGKAPRVDPSAFVAPGSLVDREAHKRRMGGEVLCYVW